MQHLVSCSRCPRRFSRGVTRVRRFIVFHFCDGCHLSHRDECERIMDKVAGPIPISLKREPGPRPARYIAAGVLAALAAVAVGCSMNQPATRNLARQTAQLAIPVTCIDRVVSAVEKKTRCDVLPKKSANDPDRAVCSHVVVQFHCTKVAPR